MKTSIRPCTSVVLAMSIASLVGLQSVAASMDLRSSDSDAWRVEFMARSVEVRRTSSRQLHPKLEAALARLEAERFVPVGDLSGTKIRAALRRVPTSTDATIERLRRGVRLADAIGESNSPRERLAVLVRFGIAGMRSDRTIAPLPRSRPVEQPDGGPSSVSSSDELDDAIAAADAEAGPAFDSAWSYAQSVVDDMDAQIADIEGATWESEDNCPVLSGPSPDVENVGADCWGEAAEAVLSSYAVKEIAQLSQTALAAAQNAFNSAKSAAVAGYAAATLSMTEAVGMVTTALGAFIASTTGEVIVVSAAVYLAADYTYELLNCMGWWPFVPEPMRSSS